MKATSDELSAQAQCVNTQSGREKLKVALLRCGSTKTWEGHMLLGQNKQEVIGLHNAAVSVNKDDNTLPTFADKAGSSLQQAGSLEWSGSNSLLYSCKVAV